MTAAELADELRWVAEALVETMDSPEPGKVSHAHDMARNALARHSADEWNAAHPIGTIVEINWGDWPTPTRSATDSAAWAEDDTTLVYIERFGNAMPVEELTVVVP